MKIITFQAKQVENVGALIKALHSIFACSIKATGTNPYGIAFPNIDTDSVGKLISIYCPQDVEKILTNKAIQPLLKQKKLSLAAITDVSDIKSPRYCAFIRDRRLERGAPTQAMKRMASSNKENKEQLAKALIGRYFQQKLPQINLSSQSSQRLFTLNVATLEANLPTTDDLSFNAYGLSSYKKPMYLPMEAIA